MTDLGGLIGTATPEKNGLLDSDVYRSSLQIISLQNGVQCIAKFTKLYEALIIKGVDIPSGDIIDVFITKGGDTIKGKGKHSIGVTFYIDVDSKIYVKVRLGYLIYAQYISLSNCALPISDVSLPADSTQIVIES